jgi:hypothetical protein
VSLSRRRLRTLRKIERDLAASDPDLNEFYMWFTLGAMGRAMPSVERVHGWPYRMLARLWRGRSPGERVKDWCAENWTDP